jgi:hypothetical protein
MQVAEKIGSERVKGGHLVTNCLAHGWNNMDSSDSTIMRNWKWLFGMGVTATAKFIL